VRLLRHPGGVNLGVGRTRRLGIMEASGDYIAYLDADDAFEPSKLERQLGLFNNHPGCVMCHTGIKPTTAPAEDPERSSWMESLATNLAAHWNGFRSRITEYSLLDLHEALRWNVVCNSTVLAKTEAVRSAAAATRQLFQIEDWVQWTLLSSKGRFVYTPEPLTRYRVHPESSSYLIHNDDLRTLYWKIEFLLTLHVLTDDSGLRARAEGELLCTLNGIKDIYAGLRPGENAESLPESTQPPQHPAANLFDQTAVQLRSQVDDLIARVAALTDQLTRIRNSKVYRGLSTIRKMLRKK
jgi:glycosyltransferase involved in cell wall biosynthesis